MIEKKGFAIYVLDLEDEPFVVNLASICKDLDVHSSQKAQIALVKADKAFTSVPPKYAKFADIFSKYLATKWSEDTGINNDIIELIEDHQPSYSPIYSLSLI